MQWLADTAPLQLPLEFRRRMIIVPSDGEVSGGPDLSLNVHWVRARETELRRYYPEDWDRYTAVQSHVLNGLFDFIQHFVWPLWVNDSCTRRLRTESRLREQESSVLRRLDGLQAAARNELMNGFQRIVVGNPQANALLHAVCDIDMTALRSFDIESQSAALGVVPQNFEDYLAAIDREDAATVKELKRKLRDGIFFRAALDYPAVAWRTERFERLEAELEAEKARTDAMAKRHYAHDFMNLCLSDTVLQMESVLFDRMRMPGSRPYVELVKLLVHSGKQLPLKKQLSG